MSSGPPGRLGKQPVSHSDFLKGASGGGGGGTFPTEHVKPTKALRGWHDLNLAVGRSLPTSLLRAGQLHRASLLALKRRGRVR